MTGTLYIITGPSGAGKTSVAMQLLAQRPQLKKVVTCTTRPPREGEVDGIDYHFLTKDVFQSLIENNAMFEWDAHYDNLYGSRKEDVHALMEAGHDVLFVVDVAGAKTIKAENPHATLIFLEAENEQDLFRRITERDGGDTAGLEERKQALEAELAFAELADHRIVNRYGKLQETVQRISALMDA